MNPAILKIHRPGRLLNIGRIAMMLAALDRIFIDMFIEKQHAWAKQGDAGQPHSKRELLAV